MLPMLAQAASETIPAYWYDGAIRRPLSIDEAAGRISAPTPTVANPDPAKVPPALRQARALQKASAPSSGATSQTDMADSGSLPIGQALPGGVVVTLKQAVPSDQARVFLQQQGLTPLRELGSASGIWLVQSEAGTASISLANKLYESGQFKAAQPNWYQPRVLK